MRKLILISLFFLIQLNGQTRQIIFIDSLNKLPIENVLIFNNNSFLGYSNFEGKFEIINLKNIKCEHISYGVFDLIVNDTIILSPIVFKSDEVIVQSENLEILMSQIIEKLENDDEEYFANAIFEDIYYKDNKLISYSEFGLDVLITPNQIIDYYLTSLGRRIKKKDIPSIGGLTFNTDKSVYIGTGIIRYVKSLKLKQKNITFLKMLFTSIDFSDALKNPFRENWKEYFQITKLESGLYQFKPKIVGLNLQEGTFKIDPQTKDIISYSAKTKVKSTKQNSFVQFEIKLNRKKTNYSYVLNDLHAVIKHFENDTTISSEIQSNMIIYNVSTDKEKFDEKKSLSKIPIIEKNGYKFIDFWNYQDSIKGIDNYSPIESSILRTYNKNDFEGVWYE